ncbi:MAG: hypothetical protein ABR614_07240, partial [Mycobacteriales bacterium]
MTRRPASRARAVGLLLAGALATAACGSTVQTTGSGGALATGGGPGANGPELGNNGLAAPGAPAPGSVAGDGTTSTTGSASDPGALGGSGG